MSNSVIQMRKNCRLCGSDRLSLALPLNDSPIGDAYVTQDQLATKQDSYPLGLHLCDACSHLQLLHVIDPNFLFGNYIYKTSTSPGLVEHFRLYAEAVYQLIPSQADTFVIEVGSNDGTLLNFFKQKSMKVLGVDPAVSIANEASAAGIETLATFFTFELAKKIKEKQGLATIISANNVFAHVDDMEDLVKGIEHLLAPEGIFVFEASYLVDMFEKNVFDTIYHEHLCYHRIEPLEKFFNRHNMTLFDIQRIPTKGGSIRGFAKLRTSQRPINNVVQKLIQQEKAMGLDKLETYQQFSANLDTIKQTLHALLEKLKKEGKSIIGYGASPAVTTTTYQFELGKYIDWIADDNSIKQGRFSPGHHLPVLSSDLIYEKKPDYILILAWQYAELIIKKHQQFAAEGGHFIIPLPNVVVR